MQLCEQQASQEFRRLDAHLLAFDAATGIQLWDAEVGDHRESFSVTGAPLVVKDLVLIGVGGGEFGWSIARGDP